MAGNFTYRILRLSALLLCILLSQLNFAQAPTVAYQPVIGPTAGLSSPIEVVSAPGDASGRLFIVEQPGRIKIWDGSSVLPTPFLDITGPVGYFGDERGLLSMAFHPDYASNGFFFVYYNDNAGNITVARYQVSADPNIAIPTPNPVTPLVSIPKPFNNHNGGHLQFRVEGGVPYLYFATGDGGSGNDPNNFSQTYTSLLGKMIRMNVDAPVPVPEIWAWGLRNPFRWSFDRLTGDMWIGDVGQSSREEINFRAGGTYGANYGWACQEGTENNASVPVTTPCDTVRAVDILPIFDYDNPTEGASVIGGYVYRGSEFPSLQGYYLATDYYSGRLWLISPDGGGGWDITTRTGFTTRVASISETTDGALYAVALESNTVYKIVVTGVTPLTLVRFYGRAFNRNHELTWVTEFEENLDDYIIEYSTDGRNFIATGQRSPRNSEGPHTYTFVRPFTGAGLTYYRLKITELDGGIKYSPIIIIGTEEESGLKLYPTTVSGSGAIVNVISGRPIEKLALVGADGRQVFSKDMNGAEGYFRLSLPPLQKGLYMLVFWSRGVQQTERILVQ